MIIKKAGSRNIPAKIKNLKILFLFIEKIFIEK